MTRSIRAALAASILLGVAGTAAADISKEQCVDAHSRGQDARDAGQITLARKLFLSCAVPACPSLVQGDCARFADDLNKVQPSVTFAARDSRGADLPDTTVYVDDALIATRLDGNQYEIDPGKHVIRFQRGRDEQSVTVVVNTGEKGRAIVASFAGLPITNQPPVTTEPVTTAPVTTAPMPRAAGTTHPTGAKVLLGLGTALVVGGGAVMIYGYGTLPSGCSLGDHECTAPPGDPVFSDAHDKVKLGNIGLIMGGAGVAAVVGGLVWYATGSHAHAETQTGVAIAPWLAPEGGGLSVSGHM